MNKSDILSRLTKDGHITKEESLILQGYEKPVMQQPGEPIFKSHELSPEELLATSFFFPVAIL